MKETIIRSLGVLVLLLGACKSPSGRVASQDAGKQKDDSIVEDVSIRNDLAALKTAWFSSSNEKVVPIPGADDLRKSYVATELELGPGIIEGFEVDLDRNGINERIIRTTGKDGRQPFHQVLFFVDGEWELAARFTGEFLLVKRAVDWPDDILVSKVDAVSGGKKVTAMKFAGMGYLDVWELLEDPKGSKVTRVSADPEVPPPFGVVGDWVSPMVGDWVSIIHLGADGPTDITTVTIEEEGAYHLVAIGMIPSEKSRGDQDQYDPVGAELKRYETGRIDLRTGREILPLGRRNEGVRSISWGVLDGKLHWYMDMGTMGGEGVTYSPVD